MKRLFITTTITAGLVLGAAQAQSVNGGAAQLALQIGVTPGEYSVAQLVRMRTALEDGNMTEFRHIRDRLRHGGFSTNTAPSVGRVALAERMEIDANEMSYADTLLLGMAKSTGQTGPVAAFWKNRDPNNPSRRASYVSPGEAQIAAGLGVDPADYTLAELVQMKVEADTD
ncbi:hypothetical protein [Rhodovulum strictum]|uniref:Uncharacterized protein n=1 Tax=Rhodovulum strictum TaxID=58314 RepID=A0A844BJ81_9RHOB|nr:hypothetical protein [Rhodovulum strictum]MRH22609.1 hypothetical protein [Rhodovulum strictum]